MIWALWLCVASPVGMAYQTWNSPLGQWQTAEQLDFDLARMQQLDIHELRVEFVWREMETAPGHYDFSRTDLLVRRARERGMRLLPIVGFQWPPADTPNEERSGAMPERAGGVVTTGPYWRYANAHARAHFADFIRAVTAHYRNEPAIAAWIVGNEFGWIDYNTKAQQGYDRDTLTAFADFARERYGTLAAVNAAWGMQLTQLAVTPDLVRIDAEEAWRRPVVRDFLEFRRALLARTIGVACRAAKEGAPRTPRIYSAIGVLYSAFDRYDVGESWQAITRACAAADAPLARFALNAYMNLNSFEPANLGIAATAAHALTGLDVTYSEFGVTSTDVYVHVGEAEQGALLTAQALAAIVDGVRAIDIFAWNDKPFVSLRERGFGILTDKREPKPAFTAVAAMQTQLATIDVAALQAALAPEPPGAVFLLPDRLDQWNSFWDETFIIASLFQRIGVPVTFATSGQLGERAHGARLIVLCRQGLLPLSTLRAAVATGVPIAAFAEPPGGTLGLTPEFHALMREVFGVDFSALNPALANHAQFFNAVVSSGADSTIFGTWFFSPASAVGAAPAPLTVHGFALRGASEVSEPLWFTFGRNLYVPFGLGDTFLPTPGDPALAHTPPATLLPSQFFAQQLAAALQLPMPPPVTRDVTAFVHLRELVGGGHVVFADAHARIGGASGAPCGGAPLIIPLALAANETLLGLTTGARVQADDSGRAHVSLAACASDIFVNETRLAAFRITAPHSASTTPSRTHAFPARVFLSAARGTHCAHDALLAFGYTEATLGITPSRDYRVFAQEPVRGFYTALGGRAELFGRAIVEGHDAETPVNAKTLSIGAPRVGAWNVANCAALDREALRHWLD